MNKKLKKQMENVKSDHANESVTNDVIKTGYEGYPGHLEEKLGDDGEDGLSDVEESVVKHSVGGKTWNTMDER